MDLSEATSGMSRPAPQKKIVCGCGKRFKNEDALRDHQRDTQGPSHHSYSVEGAHGASGPYLVSGNPEQRGGQYGTKVVAKADDTSSAKPTRLIESASTTPEKKAFKDRWLFKGKAESLAVIASSQVQPSETAVSSSGGYDLLCSYNWVKTKDPTVYVPGDPPIWVPTPVPLCLERDSRMHFIDQNGFRVPKYPFQVVFQAMEVMKPDFKFDEIDVVVNRNSLRKLLDFCRGRCRDSFRLNLYTISNTLIVERCEQSTRQMIHGAGDAGYGHNFEEAVTRPPPGMSDIAGHHRVLRYDVGGLSCAVRFEVDASCNDSLGAETEQNAKSQTKSRCDASELVDALDGLQIQDSGHEAKRVESSQVRVIARGSGIPHTMAAEIKSTVKRKPLGLILPQLWFGRTPHLIRGYHLGGVFHNIQVTNMESDLQKWEAGEENQMALRKMARLLSQLREVVKMSGTKTCMAVCESARKPVALEVFATTRQEPPLPQGVIRRFWTSS